MISWSAENVDDKWNKIIQFGEKSWTNMPFNQIIPSPSTALEWPLESSNLLRSRCLCKTKWFQKNQVKVSKSRKQIMTILSVFGLFFGRIQDALICSWELVTFSMKLQIRVQKIFCPILFNSRTDVSLVEKKVMQQVRFKSFNSAFT